MPEPLAPLLSGNLMPPGVGFGRLYARPVCGLPGNPSGTLVGPNGCFSMQSSILKRSVVIGGHKTSVSLEEAFWSSLAEIAASGQRSRSDLLAEINGRRHAPNLSSAVRQFVLQFYQDRAQQAAR